MDQLYEVVIQILKENTSIREEKLLNLIGRKLHNYIDEIAKEQGTKEGPVYINPKRINRLIGMIDGMTFILCCNSLITTEEYKTVINKVYTVFNSYTVKAN